MNDRFLSEIKSFYDKIDEANKVLVFFDTDPDGLCSYLQVKKEWSHKIVGLPFKRDRQSFEFLLENVNLSDYDTILFLDIPYLQDLDYTKGKKVIWIDHHENKHEELIREYDIDYLNPLDFDLDEMPVTFIIYFMTQRKQKEYALVGSVGDFFLDYDLLQVNKEVFPKSINEKIEGFFQNSEKISKNELVRKITYESEFGKYINYFYFIFKLKNEVMLKVIRWLERLSFEDFKIEFITEKNENILAVKKLMNRYNQFLNKALKIKVKQTGIFYVNFDSFLSLASVLSNSLSYHLKDWKILIVSFTNRNKQFASYSFRSKQRYRINEVIDRVASKYGGNGGGHPNACGGRVELARRDDFIDELICELERVIENCEKE